MRSGAAVAALALASACVLAVDAARLTEGEYRYHFESFKNKYAKTYMSDEEHAARYAIFKGNWDLALERNEEQIRWGGDPVHGMSPFLDITPENFRDMYLTRVPGPEEWPKLPVFKNMLRGALEEKSHAGEHFGAPDASIDWRSKGCVSAVKDQGQCGSCWAFSATESIESANCVASKGLPTLAPQQFVDCVTADQGCNGGMPSDAFNYAQQVGGQEAESSYPYQSGTSGSAGSCQFQRSEVAATLTGWAYASQGSDENGMMSAMNTVGPLSVVVDASSWQTYSGGVMTSCGTSLDHAVQAVGYTTGSAAKGSRSLANVGTLVQVPVSRAYDDFLGDDNVPVTDDNAPVTDDNAPVTDDNTPPPPPPTDDNTPPPPPSTDDNTPPPPPSTDDNTPPPPPSTDDNTPTPPGPSGGGYWIVRNSWSASWGESGYIRLALGQNTCGIAQYATYAKA